MQRRIAHVERAGSEQAVHEPAEGFAGHVVYVGFEDDDGVAVEVGGIGRGGRRGPCPQWGTPPLGACSAEDEGQAVGPGKALRAKAVANGAPPDGWALEGGKGG